MYDGTADVFFLVQLGMRHDLGQELPEITPYKRRAAYAVHFLRGYALHVRDVEALFQETFGGFARGIVVIENVERVVIGEIGINPVARKTAAQSVGAVVHIRHGVHHVRRGQRSALARKIAANRTAGGYPDITLPSALFDAAQHLFDFVHSYPSPLSLLPLRGRVRKKTSEGIICPFRRLCRCRIIIFFTKRNVKRFSRIFSKSVRAENRRVFSNP